MIALSTQIETLSGTIKSLHDLIEDSKNDIDNYVYTCDLNGNIIPSKVVSGSYYNSPVVELKLHNNKKIICTIDQEFPIQSYGYKKVTELVDTDFIFSCVFNINNTLIYEHNTKIFLPSDYLANEKYNLYTELYDDRNILDMLPIDTNHIVDHLLIICDITQEANQLYNRLANDVFLKDMLSVDYLKQSEVVELLKHFDISYHHKEYSDDEKKLLQLLNISIFDSGDSVELLLETLKPMELLLFEQCGIVIDDVITADHLEHAALILGYSNINHLISVNHMYGFRVISTTEGIECDVGTLELANGETIGLTSGIFVKM